MNALTLVFAALCIFAIGYRFYGVFLATKVLGLQADRPTPAVALADRQDYHPTNRYVLFGQHFAAIAAAGPLIGPVLAAQFGFLPGAIWILFGSVFAGAVHDAVVLFASVRHKGRSLSVIAEHEVGKVAGLVASFAVLFILGLTLAGLSIAVVNALFQSPWGTFTVACTIPIAFIMGIILYFQPDRIALSSAVGVVLLIAAVVGGGLIADQPDLANYFRLTKQQLAVAIPAFGVLASALPIWLLLVPRDYISTYLKLGTIAALGVVIVVVAPALKMPALTAYIHGGGPVLPGKVLPFVCITIACGALSGFHAVIGSGTTPKMLAEERDVLFVGYGAMLVEGFVAIMALITACVLVPADYFAINSSPQAFAALGMPTVDLPHLQEAIGEQLQGRPGGAVSLAVGLAYLFSSVPGMGKLIAYWYHFAIMFEAVFILTAVDTGTRVGRYLLQEMLGRVIPKFNQPGWVPGIVITSVLFTSGWGYLLYTGDISSIWPLFGMANQLLAGTALLVATTMIIRLGNARYAWVTAVPGLFIMPITFWAGFRNIFDNYVPKGLYHLVVLSVILMALLGVVVVAAMIRWGQLLGIRELVQDRYGDFVLTEVEE
jgi:carbon starvation protein